MGIDFVAFAKRYQFYLWNGSSLGGNRHRWQILIFVGLSNICYTDRK